MKKIQKSNDAVVGIVAAFLVTGLIVMVISMLQTVYIPKWMEQTEAEHMENVAEQFSQLKYIIDTQSYNKQQDPPPLSTSITLGNKEMPFLITSRSYGSLEILSDECVVTITYDNGDKTKSYNIGSIKYSSMNSYYIDQEYIYEAGALIVSQSEGNTMAVKPTIEVTQESSLDIGWSINDIQSIGDKTSMSGYGSYPVKIEYTGVIYQSGSPPPIPPLEKVTRIEIITHYPESWNSYFHTILPSAYIVKLDDGVHINLPSTTTLHIGTVDIGAQIGPGWVETTR